MPLGTVATISRNAVAPEKIANGTLYVGLENIERGGRLINVRTVAAGELASTKFAFTNSDVLFGKLRPNLCKITRPTFDGICSTDILPLTPGPDLDRNFLAHFLSQEAIVAWAAARAKGANLPRLSPSDLARLELPLPPLAEQQRSAEMLDRVDELRATRRKALALVENLRQSLFLQVFDEKSKDDWPVLTVAEIAIDKSGSIRTGPFGSDLLHSEFTESGVAVLGIDNAVQNKFEWGARRYISPQKYEQLKRYTVRPGDVLITIMGTCGRCAVVPKDVPEAINTKHLCCISLDQSKCLPEFLHAFFLFHPLAQQYLQQTAKGAIMDGLNMAIIKRLPVLVPPIEVQRNFLVRLELLNTSFADMSSQATELDRLAHSLQQRAFAGTL